MIHQPINELAKALARAQSQMKSAITDSTNPHFKNRYASLASIRDAIREPLSSNGLALNHTTQFENGTVIMTATLMHESGQFIESNYPILPTKNDPQGYGSALTYAARYTTKLIVGIDSDEDDGNDASQQPQKQQPPTKSPESIITQPQITRLWAIAGEQGWPHTKVHFEIKQRWNIETTKELTTSQYDVLVHHIQSFPSKKESETKFLDTETPLPPNTLLKLGQDLGYDQEIIEKIIGKKASEWTMNDCVEVKLRLDKARQEKIKRGLIPT